MNTSGRARNSSEMSFFVSLQACPQCGTRVDPDALKLYGDGTSWALTGNCRHCGKQVAYTFITVGDPINTEHRFDQLGEGRSELLTPAMFVAEIERIAPAIVTDPTRLGLGAWKRNRDAVDRLSLCVTELAKFLEPGEDAIAATPPIARTWIDQMTALATTTSAAIVADLPRISGVEAAADQKRPKGVNWLEREHLQAHEKWVQRGKKGAGRLVLVGAVHEDMRVGRGVELSGATFFDISMPAVSLDDARLVDAKLTDASFERGGFYGAELRSAKIERGSFRGANLETADLSEAEIDGTSFAEAELHFTQWANAKISNASFERASFGNADLDGATFKACDFRNADLAADDADKPPTTRAVFEDCDFRDSSWAGRDVSGAQFIRCRMSGLSGPVAATEGIEITASDPPAADVLRAWGTERQPT